MQLAWCKTVNGDRKSIAGLSLVDNYFSIKGEITVGASRVRAFQTPQLKNFKFCCAAWQRVEGLDVEGWDVVDVVLLPREMEESTRLIAEKRGRNGREVELDNLERIVSSLFFFSFNFKWM